MTGTVIITDLRTREARDAAEYLADSMAADKTFTMLMGSEVPPRSRFIQTHAAEVRNLDV